MSCKSPVFRPSSSCRLKKGEKSWTPAKVVQCYKAGPYKSLTEHLAFYTRCDLETCLKLAPLGQTDEINNRGIPKRHAHLCCLDSIAVDAFRKLLLENKDVIRSSQSFAELLGTIEKIADDPKCSGIGSLCSYDTATRIGSHFGHEPESIYLHAGVTKGAEKLGIDARGKKTIPADHPRIPQEFRHFSAGHLENILCIYKDCF